MKNYAILTMTCSLGLLVLNGCSFFNQEVTISESPKEILMDAFRKQKKSNSFKSETDIIYTQIDNDGGT